MMLVGLTGSIGMGKSTTAALFSELGVPVYDADAAVHDLYRLGGPAVAPVEAAFPGVVAAGAVDRARLSDKVINDAQAMKRLEQIVHPLMGEHRQTFFDRAAAAKAPIVVLDIPLLFETGGDKGMDAVVVVSAPAAMQRQRVLARPGMTSDKLDAILARQTPDEQKRSRADFVVDTSKGVEAARDQVQAILRALLDPDRAEKPRA